MIFYSNGVAQHSIHHKIKDMTVQDEREIIPKYHL